MRTRRNWTEEEVNILKECCLELGRRWWSKAETLLNRTHIQSKSKLRELVKLGFSYDSKSKINEESANVLREEIMSTPDNLVSAFERTAEKIDMKASSVKSLYYGVDNTCMSKHNLGFCFHIVSDKVTISDNTKNKIRHE